MTEDSKTPEPSPDEAALVERMRAGDREAAVAFLWVRRDEILSLGRKLMRPDDHVDREPEDLFSTLLRRVDRIVTSGRFTARNSNEANTVVFTILRRAVANVFRHGRVRRHGLARAASPEAVYEQLPEIDRRRLRAMIAALEPSAYELLVAKLRGLSSEEIAERLSTTAEAVRQRWRLLRRRLAAELLRDDHGPPPGDADIDPADGGQGQLA